MDTTTLGHIVATAIEKARARLDREKTNVDVLFFDPLPRYRAGCLLLLWPPTGRAPAYLLDWSNFNFDPHFNDLSYRNAKICGRSFGVALHESVQTLPPHPHARNALGRNNCFPADVIRDFRQISTTKPPLLVSNAQALRNRRTVHEAVVQNHPGETRGEVLDFRTFILRYTRLF
jgi:hypothetical protein